MKRYNNIKFYIISLLDFRVAIVARVSPNWTKKAEINDISSEDLSLEILQARIEINVTNSQSGIVLASLWYNM